MKTMILKSKASLKQIVLISLEVSQKLKVMKNDRYFIGFYKAWRPFKKKCKTAAVGMPLLVVAQTHTLVINRKSMKFRES